MMPTYGYVIYQAERTMTRAEQREADAQLGRLFAALPRWRRSLTRPARALRRQPGISRTSPRPCLPADAKS